MTVQARMHGLILVAQPRDLGAVGFCLLLAQRLLPHFVAVLFVVSVWLMYGRAVHLVLNWNWKYSENQTLVKMLETLDHILKEAGIAQPFAIFSLIF